MMILKLARSRRRRILDIIPPVEAQVFSDGFTDRTADGRPDVCADNEESHCLAGIAISEHIGNRGSDVRAGCGARGTGQETEDDELSDISR